MTTSRGVELMLAASVLRGLSAKGDNLRKLLVTMSVSVNQSAILGSEKEVSRDRHLVADLRDKLSDMDTLDSLILSEALCGVIHLLVRKD